MTQLEMHTLSKSPGRKKTEGCRDTERERKKDYIKENEQEIGRKRSRRGGETMEKREQRSEQ